MGEQISRMLSFGQGANTSETGISSMPLWRSFDEADVSGGGNRRRNGKVKIYQFPVTSRVVDFDGSNDAVTLTSFAPEALPTRWTMEMLFVVDDIASTRQILGGTGTGAGIRVLQNTSGTIQVIIRDSAASTTTLTFSAVSVGTVCALMVTRNGAEVTGYLNGSTQTGTMSATNVLATHTLVIGANNAAGYLDGGVDFLRFLNTVETSQKHGWIRLPDPRADNVIADWIVTLDANNYILDRGVNEYHGLATGSPASTRVPVCLNPDPVLAIGSNLNKSGARQVYAVVGDGVYPLTLA